MVAESTVSTTSTTVSTKELYKETLKARRLHGRSAVAPLLEPYLDTTRWPSGAPLPFDITEAVQKRPRGAPMMRAVHTCRLLVVPLLLGFNLCAIGCIATNRSYADGASLSTKTAVCAAMSAVAFPLCIPIFRAELVPRVPLYPHDRRSVWRQVNMLCVLLSLQESDPTQRKALLSKIRLPDPRAHRVFWESAGDLSVPAQPTQPETGPVPYLQSLLSFAEVLQQTRCQQSLWQCSFSAGRLTGVIPALQPYLGIRHLKSGKPLPPNLCNALNQADLELDRVRQLKDCVCQYLIPLPLYIWAGCIYCAMELSVFLVVLAFLYCLPLAAAITEQCPFGTSAQLMSAVAGLVICLLACIWLETVPSRIHEAHNLALYKWRPHLDVYYLLYMQDHGVPAAEPADVVHKFELGDVAYTVYSNGIHKQHRLR